MNIINSQSVEAGRSFGALLQPLAQDANESRNMALEFGRKSVHLETLRAWAIGFQERLCRDGRNDRAKAFDFWNSVNHFEGRYDKDEFRFGFWEAFHSPDHGTQN